MWSINKRKRDTEAKLMNATINEWRYGNLSFLASPCLPARRPPTSTTGG